MFMEALEASSASGRGGGIMKFIHTGDVHWGMTPDADKPWGKERAQAIRDTFKAIIDHAGAVKADCLFISGDLFHRQPLMRDIKEVNYLFSTIPDKTFLLSDCLYTSLIRHFSSTVKRISSEKTSSPSPCIIRSNAGFSIKNLFAA